MTVNKKELKKFADAIKSDVVPLLKADYNGRSGFEILEERIAKRRIQVEENKRKKGIK